MHNTGSRPLISSDNNWQGRDLYAELGVEPDVSDAELRHRWRHLAKQHHPDHGGNPDVFRRLFEAYQCMSNPAERARYDHARQQAQTEPDSPSEPENRPSATNVRAPRHERSVRPAAATVVRERVGVSFAALAASFAVSVAVAVVQWIRVATAVQQLDGRLPVPIDANAVWGRVAGDAFVHGGAVWICAAVLVEHLWRSTRLSRSTAVVFGCAAAGAVWWYTNPLALAAVAGYLLIRRVPVATTNGERRTAA
jgi:hypothetical protein